MPRNTSPPGGERQPLPQLNDQHTVPIEVVVALNNIFWIIAGVLAQQAISLLVANPPVECAKGEA